MSSSLLQRGLPCVLVVALAVFVACSANTSVQNSQNDLADSITLDPLPDTALLNEMIANSTEHISQMAPGKHQIEYLPDSASALADYAASLVSDDSTKHIHYVWGGKTLDRASKWAPPNKPGDCADRVGLDCSGFVGLVLKHFGFDLPLKEIFVGGLANSANWAPTKKRGFEVLFLPHLDVSALLPGDILIFHEAAGVRLVHTGIFWKQEGTVDGKNGPVFISALGRPSCAYDYALEDSGKPNGVSATLFGPKSQSQLYMAIRIHRNYASFEEGTDSFATRGDNPPTLLMDTDRKSLLIETCDDSSKTMRYACSIAYLTNFHGVGTYNVPVLDQDSVPNSYFTIIPQNATGAMDSFSFYVSPPRKNWQGPAGPDPGGTVTITSYSNGKPNPLGTVTGTFTLKGNAYFSRIEDTTYYVDTTRVHQKVVRYIAKQKTLSGKFEGAMGVE